MILTIENHSALFVLVPLESVDRFNPLTLVPETALEEKRTIKPQISLQSRSPDHSSSPFKYGFSRMNRSKLFLCRVRNAQQPSMATSTDLSRRPYL
jgi:hypothetical protein